MILFGFTEGKKVNFYMKYKWLNKSNNQKLIIFFNGWGMDECVVKHLDCENFDVLMFYDYNSLKSDFDFSEFDIYPEKYLVAWSMGVMIATLFGINYVSKTAINGTLKPIDDNFGIPKMIYDLTLAGFSMNGMEKFIRNMFKGNGDIPMPEREFENQKSELAALTQYEANEDFKYDKVIISDKDRIIPTKNQVKFWKTEPNVSSGHAPFYLYNKWSELL